MTAHQERTDPPIADPTWQSLWNAPNFPSYVPDHSAFSAAAAAASRIFRNRLDVVCLSADPNAAFLPNALGQVGFINPADATECFDSFTDIPDIPLV
jgi:hypothetical protein